MSQNLCALDEFFGMALHKRIVGRDVGFALSPVDQQGIDLSCGPGIQLHCCGEPCAPHTRDTRISDPCDQGVGVDCSPVRCALTGNPSILAVGFQDDAMILKT